MQLILIILAFCAIVELTRRKMISRNGIDVFTNNFIEVKRFYKQQYGIVPCVSYIVNVDMVKVFEYIKNGNAGKVVQTLQRNYHNWQRDKTESSLTIFVIENNIMIELGPDYVEILFPGTNYAYANELMKVLVTYKSPGKEEENEINIITLTNSGLELKQLDIKPTKLDIDIYYNDDFKAIDAIIQDRLKKKNDKGIILLHGLPGTGKTTYLRYLVGNLEKKVLFVSPAVAGNLMNPEFIDLLIDNPNSVVIIEDAENIIMDRKYNSNSSVSNLLNLSDGLLSDFLNAQVICTFNSSLSMVDAALMRKGRLIARYEFGKLDIKKAQRLSDHLSLNQVITKPMTLAEITNPDDQVFEIEKIEVLGFRRNELQMN